MSDPRTPTSDPVAEPQTEAGRRLVAEFGVGQFGRLERHAVAIEAEARQQARAAFAAHVDRLMELTGRSHPHDEGVECGTCEAYRLLAAAPEPSAMPDCGCNFCVTGERDGLGHDDGPADREAGW